MRACDQERKTRFLRASKALRPYQRSLVVLPGVRCEDLLDHDGGTSLEVVEE